MLDIELLTKNNFLRKRCIEPSNAARCPECGSEFIQGTDGKTSCPACLTHNPTGAFYCTRCHHETCSSGERPCSSIAAYEQCKSVIRPAFAPHEPLWQVLTHSDSTAQILEESNVRLNIAAARFSAGTKIRGESDATDSHIEDVATFQDDLRRAPTPEEARLSGADYIPSFGNWTPSDVGRPTFYEELMNEVAISPALEKLSSHLKEPPITTTEKQVLQIPPGMKPRLYKMVQIYYKFIQKVRGPEATLLQRFFGELLIFFNSRRLLKLVLIFDQRLQTLQTCLSTVQACEQAAFAQEHIAEAELLLHSVDTQKCNDKFKNIFRELAVEAQQYKFAWLENWSAEQLKTFLLNDAYFDQIGLALKRNLQDHGIYSAADVDATKIDQVPGFGPTRVNVLMRWQQECKDIVAHRAAPPIPPRRAIQMQIGLQAAIDLKKKHLACVQLTKNINLQMVHLAMDVDTARRRFRIASVTT